MAKKRFATLGIFAVLLMSLVMVSAADITYDGATLSGDNGDVVSFSINLTTDYNDTVYINWSTSSTSPVVITGFPSGANYSNGSYDISGFNATIPDYNTSRTLYANVYNATNGSFIETLSRSINFNSESGTVPSTTVDPFANYSNGVCEFLGFDEDGDLEIADLNIDNLGKGDDEEWEYLDRLEIEVEVENTNKDDSISDVEVRLIVLDNNGTDVTEDFIDDDILDDMGRIKSEDAESVYFDLEVTTDVETGDYRLYVVTYSDGNEGEECISEYDDDLYFEFEVIGYDDDEYVVTDENVLEDMDGYCGSDLELIVPVYNLEDNKEDMILVELSNAELGIREYELIDGLRGGKDDEVIFNIEVPEYADNDEYKFYVSLYYDWDDNEDEYDIMAYDLNADYDFKLNVVGCRGAAPSIVPSLESVKKVGENLVVSALITNNDKDSDIEISVSGYESWAEVVDVIPQSAYVAEGEFVEATVILTPKKAGEQSFKITTTIDGETYNQPIKVNIEDSFSLSSIVENPLYVVLIAGIAGVLVLILLALVVKLSRRRPVKPQF